MAKLDFFHSPGRGYYLFYNLDAAVGIGCPNSKDDVLLVQYLMTVCSKVPGLISLFPDMVPINGVWDKDWDGFLSYYQDDWAKSGIATWRDRRIDPAIRTGRGMGPVHHKQFKILTLNVTYQGLRPYDYPKMAEAADCPAVLRPVIRIQWLTGH
jgi:hypothetical protein